MKQLSGWMRIAIVISILWFAFWFIFGLADGKIVYGLIIPLIVVWVVVWWTARGFKSKKSDKAKDQWVDMDSVTKEKRDLEAKIEKMKTERFRYRNVK